MEYYYKKTYISVNKFETSTSSSNLCQLLVNFNFTQNSNFMSNFQLEHMIYLQCSLPLL